jgi:hypothetical protein
MSSRKAIPVNPNPPPPPGIVHDLEGVPLDQLFEEAMPSGFSFVIEFQTAPGCVLKAHSGFGHGTIAQSIIAAINSAREIKGRFR